MKGYKELKVWQRAYGLALKVYKIIEDFPHDERFGLASQLRRCGISIPSNIAEGHTRRHLKEYIQFLYIALGSLAELETQLLLAKDLTYISEMSFKETGLEIEEIGKMINGLINSLNKTGDREQVSGVKRQVSGVRG
ncbi:MAG: four helix bundle protein [Deltaproteobacteria bacterium]|nr:four helix bundle protein [Deltaproteobacteria bacterium]